jgi:hypothetical protein
MVLKKLTINGDSNISLIDIDFTTISNDEHEVKKYLIKSGSNEFTYPAVGLIGSDSDSIFDLRNIFNFFNQIAELKSDSSPFELLGEDKITYIIDFEEDGCNYSYCVTANFDGIYYEELIVDGDVEIFDEDFKKSLELSTKILNFFSNVVYYDLDLHDSPNKLINEISRSCKTNRDHFDCLKDYLIQKGYVEDMAIKEDHLVIKTQGQWETFDNCNACDIIRIILASIVLDAQKNYQLVIINGLNKNCNIYDQVIFIENFCINPNDSTASQLMFTSDQDCIEWRNAGIFDEQILFVNFEENSDLAFIKNVS